MEAYAKVLTIAIPGFVLLIILEELVARWRRIKVNAAMDTVSSLTSGLTNTIKEVLGLSIVIVGYGTLVQYFALFEIESTLSLYILAFVGLDFAGYWVHRFSHEVNIFWNRHIIHHSSEEFNLSCALRQSISQIIGIFFFLLIPMALIGIPVEVVAITGPIHLFAQFWYHTRLINKMGVLEYVIVTPSHHRVHHAINDEYLDKNFGQIFIIWDRMFGTFQEELPEVPAVYGIKKPARTWNPILINFMHVWMLAKDAWRTESFIDKLRVWFMPTGWRPKDVQSKYPIQVDDASTQVKYAPPASLFLKSWAFAQLIIHNLLIFYVLTNIGHFDYLDTLTYSAFVMISIFSYTTLMDRHPMAIATEFFKMILGFSLIFHMGGWFSLDKHIYGATTMIVAYFILSMILSVYFQVFENKEVLQMELNENRGRPNLPI